MLIEGVKTVYDGYYQAALGLTFIGGGGNTDNDMDGLLKKEEKEIGTDPENPDTDGDGLTGWRRSKYLWIKSIECRYRW